MAHEMEARMMAYLASFPETRESATISFRNSVIENIKGSRLLPHDIVQPSWIDNLTREGDYITLSNGILDVNEKILESKDFLLPHTPDFFNRVLLPYGYDPKAQCDNWERFLEEVLPDIESRVLLQEWFGYCLVHDTSQHTFLLLTGDGANGKSVVCEMLTSVLGKDNVSSISLEMFEQKYSLSATLGKLANIVAEVGEIDKTAEGFLKAFVGADLMPFEEKYKPVYTAKPTARLVFATNTLPRFVDRSNGIWRRMIIIPFDVTIPEDRQNRKLASELKQELPGILNWSLNGLKRLRIRGCFKEPGRSAEFKRQYQQDMNPAKGFFEDYCCEDDNGELEFENLYQEFTEYCRTNGQRPLNAANFGKEIMRAFPGAKKEKRRIGNARKNVYFGISFSNGYNPQGMAVGETTSQSWVLDDFDV
jgi:P4 family phage/plasmid primase-like protien